MKPRLASWETIKKEYPDRFVLLENPVFDPTPHLKEAILLYKHKDQKKVIKKSLELQPYDAAIVYGWYQVRPYRRKYIDDMTHELLYPKKRMKFKFICGVLICLSLFACRQTAERYVIGVSQCSSDEWRQKMNTEMQHEALLHQGVILDIKTVVDDTEQQIRDIQTFIDSRVDLIVVSPNKAEPVTSIIEKAYASGIPVVLVDRKILSDNYTAFIGADNYQIGKEVGGYIARLLEGKGNIVEIRGLEGSTPATERHQGFMSVISGYPEIKVVQSIDGAWLKDVAENKMEEVLADSLAIDAVYAHNDRMAIGAYHATDRRDRAGGIYFLGIDALPGIGGGIELVLEKKLKATFIYPTNGDKIVQLALDILQGKPYEKNNTLYTNIVDETNARVLKLQTDAIIEQENKISMLNDKINAYLSQFITQRYLLLSVTVIVLILGIFFILLFRAYHAKNRLNIELKKRNDEINEQKILLEQQRDRLILLSRQLEEATHAKLVFFTNISHEFRTPLTLIAGPVNSLLSGKSIDIEQRRLLTLVQKNIVILLKLIDQIIDFRKYENGKLTLSLEPCDLKQLFIEWNESFAEMAKRRRLHFSFNVFSDAGFLLPVDIAKMERIYFNLLSNAFKFTPEKGTVSVHLDKITHDDTDYVVMEVSNSGKGISKEDIEHIFERFYQIDSSMAGSGIGLALTKALVELHQGQIRVNSEQEGWTTFTVQIPFLQDVKPEHVVSGKVRQPILQDVKPEHVVSEKVRQPVIAADEMYRREMPDENRNDNKQLILVIDDNPDICSYIKTILHGEKYTVIEAHDGDEGFRKTVKHIPDIIISDVMMPKTDGVELCKKLKEELSTSHIPVILLTACSLDEQRITGFKCGADDYITKPFNSDVLEVRIGNLIESRKRLKELFRENLFSVNIQTAGNDMERMFLGKLKQLIEKNLSDSELSVEDLGQDIGLSRTQLYRKVKSLTNYSPNELLRIIRLQEARRLLSVTELNISQVAYDVGFTSPSYFAKCFKEYYNESPADYLKQVR